MKQNIDERGFSIRKHASGGWRTTLLTVSNPLVRRLSVFLSFKNQELFEFAKRCNACDIVLDLGAGCGSYSAFFLQCRPCTVIAVDWVYEALRKIPSLHKNKILPICADIRRLPIKSGRIDAVFSIDTLGHIREQETALDEINRICRTGAPVFLHCETSDYRSRLPDRLLIKKYGFDPIAEQDGHIGIKSSQQMRSLYEQRFLVIKFFSPAGIFGWLLGYPEKYWRLLFSSRMFFFAIPSAFTAFFKKIAGLKVLLRLINICTNRLELFLGLEAGGSCFARCRTIVPEPGTERSRQSGIDIVIPTYRRSLLGGSLLTDLISQCYDVDRIFVVWQGKNKPQLVDHPAIRYIHCPKPNLPASRNAGIMAGGNPIILFLDDDCTIKPGLLDAHRACYYDPSIGAVAGYVDDPLFESDPTTIPSKFDIKSGELIQKFDIFQSGPSISVMGTNMSFRRSAIEKIGGFDIHYTHNAIWEEIDASFRILNAGYNIYYCASAKVVHHRCPQGGCRTDGKLSDTFHMFANTAYFACTFADIKYIKGWINFWKYRLEYSSRISHEKVNGNKYCHDVRVVFAGLSGAVFGILIFLTHGTRCSLPRIVIEQYTNISGRNI